MLFNLILTKTTKNLYEVAAIIILIYRYGNWGIKKKSSHSCTANK